MRSLFLRIWLTVVLSLALFAGVAGWIMQRHLEQERVRYESVAQERVAAWAELLQRSLPRADAPAAEQAEALREWAQRLRLPLALDDAGGRRIGASDFFRRREAESLLAGVPLGPRVQAIRFDDGRTLWVMRSMALRGPPGGPRMLDGPGAGTGAGPGPMPPWTGRPRPVEGVLGGWAGRLPEGVGLAALLLLLFTAVAAGAWPVVRRLTRRLEALKLGVEEFGAGALHRRVAEEGRDEVAALGASFNRAAGRIEALLRSHQSLLANASHELRSPLARLKMAVAMMEEAPPAQRDALKREIHTDIAELDALVEEVLLASRLDATQSLARHDRVALLALAAEEAARVHSDASGDDVTLPGDEKLLRRALRNLLENARRYGGDEVELVVSAAPATVEVRVCDRGPGVPEAYRERIFEPFFRLPGHAEREGGVGLGLALVRQIAERHGGSVRCEPRPGGGSCFTLVLPRS